MGLSMLAVRSDAAAAWEASVGAPSRYGKVTRLSHAAGHAGWLFDSEGPDDLPPDQGSYLKLVLDGRGDTSGLSWEGGWLDGIEAFGLSVAGAMTFLLVDEDDERADWQRLRTLFSLHLVRDRIAEIEAFAATHGLPWDAWESTDLDPETDEAFAVFREIAEQHGLDFEGSFMQDVQDQLLLRRLGLREHDADESTGLLLYSLEPDLQAFLAHAEFLSDLLDDLADGPNESLACAYSLWHRTEYEELYSEHGLEDGGEHLSYPTLYAGAYQGEPETGRWYES